MVTGLLRLEVSGKPPPWLKLKGQVSMDEMIRQLVSLSSKVAVLEAERPRAARVVPQAPASEARGLPNGVKALAPPSFHGSNDRNTVKDFVDALDTYFELVQMRNLG